MAPGLATTSYRLFPPAAGGNKPTTPGMDRPT